MKITFNQSGFDLPHVELDTEFKILEIKGRSIPENSYEFYSRVQGWIDSQFATENGDDYCMHFHFDIISSSSLKPIFRIIHTSILRHPSIMIKWEYDKDDEDMLNIGELLQKQTQHTFEFITTK
jgi:hypothetical protein